MKNFRIRKDIDLEELVKFGYKKVGGTEPYWHFYYWIKEIHGFFNDYYIIVNGASRKISMFENSSPDKSFSNKIEINKKKLIHDLIKEKLVEGENKWFLH